MAEDSTAKTDKFSVYSVEKTDSLSRLNIDQLETLSKERSNNRKSFYENYLDFYRDNLLLSYEILKREKQDIDIMAAINKLSLKLDCTLEMLDCPRNHLPSAEAQMEDDKITSQQSKMPGDDATKEDLNGEQSVSNPVSSEKIKKSSPEVSTPDPKVNIPLLEERMKDEDFRSNWVAKMKRLVAWQDLSTSVWAILKNIFNNDKEEIVKYTWIGRRKNQVNQKQQFCQYERIMCGIVDACRGAFNSTEDDLSLKIKRITAEFFKCVSSNYVRKKQKLSASNSVEDTNVSSSKKRRNTEDETSVGDTDTAPVYKESVGEKKSSEEDTSEPSSKKRRNAEEESSVGVTNGAPENERNNLEKESSLEDTIVSPNSKDNDGKEECKLQDTNVPPRNQVINVEQESSVEDTTEESREDEERQEDTNASQTDATEDDLDMLEERMKNVEFKSQWVASVKELVVSDSLTTSVCKIMQNIFDNDTKEITQYDWQGGDTSTKKQFSKFKGIISGISEACKSTFCAQGAEDNLSLKINDAIRDFFKNNSANQIETQVLGDKDIEEEITAEDSNAEGIEHATSEDFTESNTGIAASDLEVNIPLLEERMKNELFRSKWVGKMKRYVVSRDLGASVRGILRTIFHGDKKEMLKFTWRGKHGCSQIRFIQFTGIFDGILEACLESFNDTKGDLSLKIQDVVKSFFKNTLSNYIKKQKLRNTDIEEKDQEDTNVSNETKKSKEKKH